jgi:hypothetical protein
MFEARRARSARRSPLAASLFLAGGLAAAFLVSAIAGLGDVPAAADGPLDNGRAAATSAWAGRQAALGDARRTTPLPAHVRVEVLNGSGVGGLAREATYRLRDEGFDVVFFGNAPRFDHGRSLVLDRAGDTLAARLVATALGIDSVAPATDPRLLLDVTVVLGSDWPPTVAERPGALVRLRRLVAPPDTAQ